MPKKRLWLATTKAAREAGFSNELDFQQARIDARDEATRQRVHPYTIYHKRNLLRAGERKQMGLTNDE